MNLAPDRQPRPGPARRRSRPQQRGAARQGGSTAQWDGAVVAVPESPASPAGRRARERADSRTSGATCADRTGSYFAMALFLAIVVAIAIVLGPSLLNAFLRNPAFNGIIFGLLIAGIAYIFRQVVQLEPASAWIDDFRERLANRDLTAPPGPAPRMLAPMARMLSSRQSGRVTLSPASLQTLLDGIAARLDETRETSRYLIGTLVFLGSARDVLRPAGDRAARSAT